MPPAGGTGRVRGLPLPHPPLAKAFPR
jgi:hypothetical protein